jgi:hypothetical protein
MGLIIVAVKLFAELESVNSRLSAALRRRRDMFRSCGQPHHILRKTIRVRA